jgi:MFS family permease
MALWRERNIGRLFLAQTISFLGTWISLIALNVKIYDLTHSSLGVAAVFLLTALPSLLAGLVGGVYVDRFDRKKLMIAADLSRAVLTVLILASNQVAVLYGLIVCHALAGAIFRMARLAVVPQLVADKKKLLSVNALLNLTQAVTLTLGPAVGGLLVTFVGVRAAFALDAASFVWSAALIATMQIPTLEAARLPAGRSRQQMAEGFRFIVANRPVTILIIATTALMLGSGAVNALEIIYARTILQVDDTGYGLLLSSWGLGLLLGTLVLGRIGRWEMGRTFIAAMMLLGLVVVVYGYAPNLAVAISLGVTGGVGNGILLSLIQTLLQSQTPVEMLGRVGGFFTTARDVASFVAMLLAGLAADLVSIPLIFAVAGLLVMAAAVLPLLLGANSSSRLDWLAAPAQ